jgi:hypothetical protein
MATWFEVAYQHALSFGLGLAIGFVLSNRYGIVRKNEGIDDGSS